jgi:riboflavin kinase/FMN adenylyltransferase
MDEILEKLPIGKFADEDYKSAITIGNFESVHIGHQKLFKTLIDTAKNNNLKSIAIIICKPNERTLLNDFDIIRNIVCSGVDDVLIIEGSSTLYDVTYEEFVEDYLIKRLNMQILVKGKRSVIGKNKKGDTEALKTLSGNLESFQVIEVEYGEDYSSSNIKRLLSEGKIRKANSLLGYDYYSIGVIIRGEKRGRELGFPTANFGQIETILPMDGVYAGYLDVCYERNTDDEKKNEDGKSHADSELNKDKKESTSTDIHINEDGSYWKRYPAIASIGPAPTFSRQEKILEVNAIGYTDLELYDLLAIFTYRDKVRDIVKFNSKDELIEQLNDDVEKAKTLLKGK